MIRDVLFLLSLHTINSLPLIIAKNFSRSTEVIYNDRPIFVAYFIWNAIFKMFRPFCFSQPNILHISFNPRIFISAIIHLTIFLCYQIHHNQRHQDSILPRRKFKADVSESGADRYCRSRKLSCQKLHKPENEGFTYNLHLCLLSAQSAFQLLQVQKPPCSDQLRVQTMLFRTGVAFHCLRTSSLPLHICLNNRGSLCIRLVDYLLGTSDD